MLVSRKYKVKALLSKTDNKKPYVIQAYSVPLLIHYLHWNDVPVSYHS